MRIALAGPIEIGPLREWLRDDGHEAALPPGLGGTSVTQLARGLLRRGLSVTVVTLAPGIEDEVVACGPRLRLRVGLHRDHHRARDGFRVERRYIARALRAEGCDIVHAHWTYEYAVGALASRRPTLITVRDWAPAILRMNPIPYRFATTVVAAEALLRGKHFTAVSPYIQTRVRRWTRKDIRLIPNGLDDSLFSSEPRAANLDSPRIVAINDGFGRRKNVSTLLKAFPLVRAWNPSARLELVGNNFEWEGRAHAWAAEMGFAAGVGFHGPVPHEEVHRLLRMADLFVHPSLEESFGNVLVEAMAQGTPVVAGRNSGAVPWVLDGGRAGMLADVHSPERLAEAIIRVLSRGEEWLRLSRAGFEHAYSHFRLSRVVDDYLSVYEELLSPIRG